MSLKDCYFNNLGPFECCLRVIFLTSGGFNCIFKYPALINDTIEVMKSLFYVKSSLPLKNIMKVIMMGIIIDDGIFAYSFYNNKNIKINNK